MGNANRPGKAWVMLSICLLTARIGQAQGVAYVHDLSGNPTLRENSSIGVPLILQQPGTLVVRSASVARFSVVVADASSAAYQWKFKGTNIAGATSDTLAITNVSAASEGAYTVTVTNSAGTV